MSSSPSRGQSVSQRSVPKSLPTLDDPKNVKKAFQKSIWKAHTQVHGLTEGAEKFADTAIQVSIDAQKAKKQPLSSGTSEKQTLIARQKGNAKGGPLGGGPLGGGGHSVPKAKANPTRERSMTQSSLGSSGKSRPTRERSMTQSSFGSSGKLEPIVVPSLAELSSMLSSTATFLKDAARQPPPQIHRMTSPSCGSTAAGTQKQFQESTKASLGTVSLDKTKGLQVLSGHTYWHNDRPFWRTADDDRPVSSTGIPHDAWLKQRLSIWDDKTAAHAHDHAGGGPEKKAAAKKPPPPKRKSIDTPEVKPEEQGKAKADGSEPKAGVKLPSIVAANEGDGSAPTAPASPSQENLGGKGRKGSKANRSTRAASLPSLPTLVQVPEEEGESPNKKVSFEGDEGNATAQSSKAEALAQNVFKEFVPDESGNGLTPEEFKAALEKLEERKKRHQEKKDARLKAKDIQMKKLARGQKAFEAHIKHHLDPEGKAEAGDPPVDERDELPEVPKFIEKDGRRRSVGMMDLVGARRASAPTVPTVMT